MVPQRFFQHCPHGAKATATLCVKDPFHARSLLAWSKERFLADGDSRCGGSSGEPGPRIAVGARMLACGVMP